MKKQILAAILCLCTIVNLFTFNVFAESSDDFVAKIGDVEYSSVQAAITAAHENEETTIYLGARTYTSADFGKLKNCANKTLNFIGAGVDKTSCILNTNMIFTDNEETITFQNIYFEANLPNKGFTSNGTIKAIDCSFNGVIGTWGKYAEFESCNFKQTINCGAYTYMLWSYAPYKWTVTNCFFDGNRVFNVDADIYHDVTINFKDNTVKGNWTETEYLNGKTRSVLNIHDALPASKVATGWPKYTINFYGNNTVTGFYPHSTTCSELYQVEKTTTANVDKGVFATVTYEGVTIWENGTWAFGHDNPDTNGNIHTEHANYPANVKTTYTDWYTNNEGQRARDWEKKCMYCSHIYGNGTELLDWHAKDINIVTPEDLIAFVEVNRGETHCGNKDCAEDAMHTFEGQTIHLVNDIDLGEYWWFFNDGTTNNFEIDRRIVDFRGVFDGHNYAIRNMKYHDSVGLEKDNSYIGLAMFRDLYGTVQNLKIVGVGGYFDTDGTTLLPAELSINTRFATLANRPRGATISKVEVRNVNVHFNNKSEKDANSSFSGMLGIVTYDSSRYKGTTVTDCAIFDVKASLDGSNSYAGGGFALKASEMAEFNNCSVSNFELTVGGNIDNYGGFIGHAGNIANFTRCKIDHVTINVAGQNNEAVGGFVGTTVGGTGWGPDSVHFTGCGMDETTIVIGKANYSVGGFVGDLNAARSGIFTNCEVDVKTSITVNDGNGTSGVGGFIGGLTGRTDLISSAEHKFSQCNTSATVVAINSPVGGFVGAAAKGSEKHQMRVEFNNCGSYAKLSSTNTATGFGFVGEGDIGDRENGDKSYDEYIDCVDNTSILSGNAPANEVQVLTTGGSSVYSRTTANGFMELTDTTSESTVYTTFQDPSVQVFRLLRAAIEPEKTVTVTFYRKNAEGEFEAWREIQLFKDTAFDGTGYPYAETYADYRIAGGLASVLAEADALFTKAVAMYFVDENGELFTDSTMVYSDINVYVEYGYMVTYEFEGDIPEGAVLPEAKAYKPGELVALAGAPAKVKGYEFLGWDRYFDFTMPENDIVITGSWREGYRPAIVNIVGEATLDGEAANGLKYVLTDRAGKTVATATAVDGEFNFKLELEGDGDNYYTISQVSADGVLCSDKYDVRIHVREGNSSYKAQVCIMRAEKVAFTAVSVAD